MQGSMLTPLLLCASCLGPIQEEKQDSAEGATLWVEIQSPLHDGDAFWQGVPYRFEVAAGAAGGELAVVRLEGVYEDGTKVLAEEEYTDHDGGNFIFDVGLDYGILGVEAVAQDLAGDEARDHVDVTVLSCDEFVPVVRWTFDEDQGSTIPDSSAYGTMGTLSSRGNPYDNPTYVEGVFGQALDLSSGTASIKGTFPDISDTKNEFAMMGYFKIDPSYKEEPIFIIEGPTGFFSVDLWTDSIRVTLAGVTSEASTGVASYLCDGSWHQLALVLNSSGELSIHVDGEVKYSDTFHFNTLPWDENDFQVAGNREGTHLAHLVIDDFTVLSGVISTQAQTEARLAKTAFCY